MKLDIFNSLISHIKENDFVKEFINDLSNDIEDKRNSNSLKSLEKYTKYWVEKRFMEDAVAANIGISRWSANIRYCEEISKAIDDSLSKLSRIEGTLYRKKFTANGPTDNQAYSVDKFEKGKVEHLILSSDKVPKGLEDADIIFQYKEDENIKVRMDLKEKVIESATKSTRFLKIQENEKALDYKKEGHVYEVIEDDGYIFLKDLTEKRGFVLEDIDFIVDCYKGEGRYQVISGKYEKITNQVE